MNKWASWLDGSSKKWTKNRLWSSKPSAHGIWMSGLHDKYKSVAKFWRKCSKSKFLKDMHFCARLPVNVVFCLWPIKTILVIEKSHYHFLVFDATLIDDNRSAIFRSAQYRSFLCFINMSRILTSREESYLRVLMHPSFPSNLNVDVMEHSQFHTIRSLPTWKFRISWKVQRLFLLNEYPLFKIIDPNLRGNRINNVTGTVKRNHCSPWGFDRKWYGSRYLAHQGSRYSQLIIQHLLNCYWDPEI